MDKWLSGIPLFIMEGVKEKIIFCFLYYFFIQKKIDFQEAIFFIQKN